jgi:hypothetical protein
MLKIDFVSFLEWIKERWHSRYVLLILLLVTPLTLLIFFSNIDLNKLSGPNIILIIFILSFVCLIWIITTRVPKTSNNKIGFVLAISTENQKQFIKLKSDFIDNLNKFSSQGNLSYQYQYIIYPEYYAKKLKSQEIAIEYLKKSRAHFLLYGQCRERNIDGKEHTVLDLNGAVSHRPLPEIVQKQFAAEFTELLPNRLAISKENDLFSFECASDWVSLVARYIVATASLLSGDFEYSRSLYIALRNELKRINTNIPSIVKIKVRLAPRLADTIATIARIKYLKYKIERDEKYLDEMGNELQQLEKVPSDHYGGHLLRATYYFLKFRDTKRALREIKSCKDVQDGAWLFSYAFLKAYNGDLRLAHSKYKSALKHVYAESVPLECEEFINDILQVEPHKYQLYYCLGVINFEVKNDYATAKKDFEIFLSSGIQSEFVEHRKLAKEYIFQIENKSKIT